MAASASLVRVEGGAVNPRRIQLCGGPSLARPARRGGCAGHCVCGGAVVAEGKTCGHLVYKR